MTAALRDQARERFCDTLLQVGPDATTLCEGWDAHRLAAHVWTLSYDAVAWLGIALAPFASLTERRLDRVVQRWPYKELVARLRQMQGFRCMPTDAWEGHRHGLGEYVVHTEDVRRANGLPSLKPDPELARALWLRLQVAARQLHGRPGRPGLVVDCTDAGEGPHVVRPGAGNVVTGPVVELLMWVYGRRQAADVTVKPAASA